MVTFVEFMLSFVAKQARRRTWTCLLDWGVGVDIRLADSALLSNAAR
jgi:hypothetical protein